MWQYKGTLFNPRYGPVGLIAMPFFTFGEALAPLIEVMGYVVTIAGLALGVVDVPFALLFVLVAWGYGMLLSLWAVVLEEVSFRRYRRIGRSEEHTSELQSLAYLVCRLLLEKKKKKK